MQDFSQYQTTLFTFEAEDADGETCEIQVAGETASEVLEEARDQFAQTYDVEDTDGITEENVTNQETVIDSEAFFDHYKPIENPANSDPEYRMYETYGAEHDAVRAADPKTVWTVVSAEDSQYITAGYHFVNRLGYYIAEVPRTEEAEEELEFFDC